MNELNQYGILSGNEIRQRMSKGDIIIHPYNDQQLGPNSYNLRLLDRMLVYTEAVLDPKRDNRTREIIIPQEGYVLKPGRVYIASTEEWTETRNLVPMLVGRSSVGRLGLSVHVTAGFGDIGFRGRWTLELVATEPVRIYPGMEICQIYYHTICGVILDEYVGKYVGQEAATPSRLYQEADQWEKPAKTNADALREMDTDALAALLGCGPCPPDMPKDECLDDGEGDCCKCWRRWLDLPAGDREMWDAE